MTKKTFKAKTIKEALSEIDNKWELIGFLFAYRSKELLMGAVIILVALQLYPSIIDWLKGLFS